MGFLANQLWQGGGLGSPRPRKPHRTTQERGGGLPAAESTMATMGTHDSYVRQSLPSAASCACAVSMSGAYPLYYCQRRL